MKIKSHNTQIVMPDVQDILEAIRDNAKILASCDFHEFSRAEIDPDVHMPASRWVCIHCGGRVDAGHVLAYREGLTHAMRAVLAGKTIDVDRFLALKGDVD